MELAVEVAGVLLLRPRRRRRPALPANQEGERLRSALLTLLLLLVAEVLAHLHLRVLRVVSLPCWTFLFCPRVAIDSLVPWCAWDRAKEDVPCRLGSPRSGADPRETCTRSQHVCASDRLVGDVTGKLGTSIRSALALSVPTMTTLLFVTEPLGTLA